MIQTAEPCIASNVSLWSETVGGRLAHAFAVAVAKTSKQNLREVCIAHTDVRAGRASFDDFD